MLRNSRAAVVAVSILGLSLSIAAAQSDSTRQRTARDGVFTAAQAERGREAYEGTSCERCHLDTLEGREQGGGGNGGAPLKGLRFIQDFGESRLSTLVNKMRVDKPNEDPGTLSEQTALDIAAYILLKNDYPAGAAELTSESAAATWIPGPPGATGIANHTVVNSSGCLFHDPTDSWLLIKALPLSPVTPAMQAAAATSNGSASTHTFRLLNAYSNNAASFANRTVKVEGYLVRLGAEIRVSLTSLEPAGGPCSP